MPISIAILETKAGRLIFNGFSTGVEVCPSMVHGGPYPATSDGRSTAVGTRAIDRFSRLVCLSEFPEASLPMNSKSRIRSASHRMVDGKLVSEGIRRVDLAARSARVPVAFRSKVERESDHF